ncbi:hypothetical protein PBI_CHE8_94 [Mycobacterium phage Che8]|uniref:Uncharacterized protein n=1 Tax=Mycobacterium virus Che8 TaxID=205868 RepID=Q855B6_9CAUD|nr:hypothetical protein PBI_CHE8_94 [Mycobacterium phage Che8]AAN12492.1 hypothetical protein PBI_CHE8_94 [Mycobacterium phage Che8]
MSDVVERAKAALDDTRCTDTMMDFFQVGLVRELVAEVERLRAQETRIRELCEDPSHGPLYPYKILAALDTEGEA